MESNFVQNYSVGFTIHEAQGLRPRRGHVLDPLVVVRCCGKEYRTEIKHGKINLVSWDESYTWTDIALTEQQWNSSFIEFEVQCANSFWRNDVLGTATLQLKLVQQRASHFVKQTVPLVKKNKTELQGQLLISVFACNENNLPPCQSDLMPEEEIKSTELEDLRNAVVTASGLIHFCNTHTEARECAAHTFNECFRIPLITPIVEDDILIKLWEKTALNSDQLLANQVQKIFTYLHRWYNLYGFTKQEHGKIESIQSDNTLEKNYYIGRLLLSARTEKLSKIGSLMPACSIPTLTYDEPEAKTTLLLADIYEVLQIYLVAK
ncbi:putative heat shock protein DnaJ pfj4 [Cardiosporidium cionae]|uniref:Heat shock protein DnaJ pfj4 n=1 Tax=Cardiosporidium cionae TaxID=476202 RepID=A0ABQ7JFB1_9APIC|nr:putative heat shock protein DnaJ pfj4 [Cardiosporidium cionae]|eukprot:KAF8822684.1 putative heat shock protein DnaJ pfj4 [Cardiosporidium cionae]